MSWERIQKYNQGRDPERLALKYKKMIGDPLAFFRGTAHLFYEDWPADRTLRIAPAVWLCGDLHLENFGTYRADNRLMYFDCNDFDESCLGPATFDIARLLTSVAIECAEREYKAKDTRVLCGRVAEAFEAELRTGKPRWTERETSTGIIQQLFDGLRVRTAQKFLNARTVLDGRKRRLNLETGRALPAAEKDLISLRAHFAKGERFRLVDAARRIAGNGSLGVPRFVVLAEDAERNPYLLDLKQAQPAAPALFQPLCRQPKWRNEAERIVSSQTLVLAMPPAFLEAETFMGKGWVLRELLPSEDRVNVSRSPERAFVEYSVTLGALAAWGHLRASGRRGADNGDVLTDWGAPVKRLVDFALDYSRQAAKDWKSFRAAREASTGNPR